MIGLRDHSPKEQCHHLLLIQIIQVLRIQVDKAHQRIQIIFQFRFLKNHKDHTMLKYND